MTPAYYEIARDTLLLSPRLLTAGARVLLGRLRRQPGRIEKFTSIDWLAERLQVDVRHIESATIEEVHSGTATRSRLHIVYAGSAEAPVGPVSLFVKSRPPDLAANLFGVLLDLGGNEVSFYRNIRPDLPVKAPGVFHCEGDSSDYAMLLEDLTEQGCDFRDVTSKCSLEDATGVVTTLAKLHAAFWQSERFETDLAWVKRFETNGDARLLNLVRKLSVPIAFEKFSSLLSPQIRDIAPRLLLHYPLLEERWSQEPRTLIHGDAHLGNMYFQNGTVGLLDWQVHQYGQGMRDISYFLVNSLQTELRLAHQEELIRHYLAVLRGLGVSFEFDAAWAQYRLQSVYAWIAAVVTAPSNFQEERVVAAGLTRACKAVVDLDAIGLIEGS